MTEAKNGKKSTSRKAVDVIEWILIVLLALFDILILIMRINMPSQDSGMNLFGNEVRIVLTGSMEGSEEFYASHPEYEIQSLPVDSAVTVRTVPTDEREQEEFYSDMKVGDILTFYYQLGSKAIPVTHRIVNIDAHTGTNGNEIYRFTCMGDNPTGDQTVSKFSPTQEVSSDSGLVIGKVTGVSVGLGWFLVHFVQNRMVVVFVVIVPCFAMMVYELVKVFMVIRKDKDSKAKAEAQARLDAQRSEVEELKKQIEELKKNKPSDNDGKEETEEDVTH